MSWSEILVVAAKEPGISSQSYYGMLTYSKTFHRYFRHKFTIWYKRKVTPLRFFSIGHFVPDFRKIVFSIDYTK